MLFIVNNDASVNSVDLTTFEIKEVITQKSLKQLATKMRLYDKVVNLVDLNVDAG